MLKILERSKGNVIGFENGPVVTMEEQLAAEKAAEALIAEHGKINWLYVWNTSKYENLRTMYEDMMWLLKHLKNFDRMAVVGDSTLKKILVKADGMIFGEKYFDIADIEKAWEYVEGKDE